jgi:hypothetical protein
MAHYIAEKMTLAEDVVGDVKINAEQQCFDTILQLWQHRFYFPDGRRPFESFDPIFRTLERLDPDNPNPYFYPTAPHDLNESDDVHQWLAVALGIDQAARIWLEYAFRRASLNATDEKTLAWLENLGGLPKDDDVSAIIRLVYSDIESDSQNTAQEAEQAQQATKEGIKSKIKKLDAFTEFSQALRAELVSELEVITSNSSIEVSITDSGS